MEFVISTGSWYSVTDYETLCLVVERNNEDRTFNLIVVSGPHRNDLNVINADMRSFASITIEEYVTRFPDKEINYEFIKLYEAMTSDPEKYCLMKMSDTYTPSDEEIDTLVAECKALMEEYDYNPTDDGIGKFLDEFFKNKGPLINVFAKHPNYNGKYQIAFDQNYDSAIDGTAICDFADWIKRNIDNILEPVMIDGFTYRDVYNYGKNHEKFINLSEDKRIEIFNKIREQASYSVITKRMLGNLYVDANKVDSIRYFLDFIYDFKVTFLDQSMAASIIERFPETKAVSGQKLSRVVNKIAKLTGIDKLADYNKEFAKYSDAVNPLKITRHTVLSLHPVDYLTMSFGNSWSSCHTIDKQNRRNMPNSYEGAYSAGTMSYMLDESSFVFYTVDAKYAGNELELQPKISRCMFHVGQDKLIQARMYPQSNDGDTGLYKDVREIAQSVISECFAFPNYWSIEKGVSACRSVSSSKGPHYRDYLNFDYCNVSYPKRDNAMKNYKKIKIGHYAICPSCGSEHGNSNCIECDDCRDDIHVCCACGNSEGDGYEMYEIDGEWYCEHCSAYCDFHDRREAIDPDDMYYVNRYGYICCEARNTKYFVECEHCGDLLYVNDSSTYSADDGVYFCSLGCASEDGYVRVPGGRLTHGSNTFKCKKCGVIHHLDYMSEQEGLCSSCYKRINNEEVA